MTEAHRKLRDRLLRESGFIDLEDAAGNMEPTIRPHGPIVGRDRTPEEIGQLAEYYRLAGQFLHSHPFASSVERRVWELHGDGASYTRIARTVRREIAAGELPSRFVAARQQRNRFYRKLVYLVVSDLRATMMGERRPRRGPRPDPTSMVQDGVSVFVRLDRSAAEAMDYVTGRLGVGGPQALRMAIVALARTIPKR